jgi:hypothetical protein
MTHLPALLAFATSPNMAVTATGVPGDSREASPYPTMQMFVRQRSDACGPQRLCWGTDVSKRPCSWRPCVTMGTAERPWLSEADKTRMMGEAWCAWWGEDRAVEERDVATERRRWMDSSTHWVGTWAMAPAPSEAGITISDQTVRMHPRVSLGGDTIRVRLSNAYGTAPLAVGAAYVGLRDQGPAMVSSSVRPLTCGGSPTMTITAGALGISDAIQIEMPPLADLAVSVYLPGILLRTFQSTGRYTYCIPSNDSASILSYQELPTTIPCGEAMARRRK